MSGLRSALVPFAASFLGFAAAAALLGPPQAGAGAVASENGDTNGDGTIDVSDVMYTLAFLFRGGPGPVALAQEGGGLTAEQAEILSYMRLVDLPIGGYCVDGNQDPEDPPQDPCAPPETGKAIRFEGVNVQIVNGTGATSEKNGLGNLIVGYHETRSWWYDPSPCWDERENIRTGSHNVVIGPWHNYVDNGGIVSGSSNSLWQPGTSIIGGRHNRANGENSVLLGGVNNDTWDENSVLVAGAGTSLSALNGGIVNPGELTNLSDSCPE